MRIINFVYNGFVEASIDVLLGLVLATNDSKVNSSDSISSRLDNLASEISFNDFMS